MCVIWMDREQYKAYHEHQMAFNNGTSKEECAIVLSIVPFAVFISQWVTSKRSPGISPVVEFIIIILPVIFNVTIFSEINNLILIITVFVAIAIVMINSSIENIRSALDLPVQCNRAIITNFRASTYFFSAICIMAVDFHAFPRKFAKTETVGFGLMDLGVGFFICSNGLVEKHSKTKQRFLKVLKNSCVLFLLGLCRLAVIKVTGYHEHLTEYGSHWNFFFTLALCKIFTYFITYLLQCDKPILFTLVLGVLHELCLHLWLKEWVLSDAPRDTLVSANREGLVSCLGFICLYFAACSLRTFITQIHNTTYKVQLVKLFLWSLITWVVTHVFSNVTGISRRIINLGYIFWVMSLTLTVILLFYLAEIGMMSIVKHNVPLSAPLLFQGINANGLLFFLLSNLLTGLVNLVCYPLLLTQTLSIIIIIIYMMLLCITTHKLFQKEDKCGGASGDCLKKSF